MPRHSMRRTFAQATATPGLEVAKPCYCASIMGIDMSSAVLPSTHSR